MKKIIFLQSLVLTSLVVAAPILAQSADVSKIQNFIQSVVQILVTLSGFVATGFFVWGGFRYITSSGNPAALDGAKKTIFFSAFGLAIVFAALVLSNVVTHVATSAFGGAQ